MKLGCLTGGVPVRIVWKDDELDIGIENPFLTLPDPEALSPREGNRLIRIVKRPISECKEDPEYDKMAVDKLTAEQKLNETPIFDQVVRVAEKIIQSAGEGDTNNGNI